MRHLDEVVLGCDELEALKLHDVDELEHIEATKKMKISQPTFGRILDSAYKKIAEAEPGYDRKKIYLVWLKNYHMIGEFPFC